MHSTLVRALRCAALVASCVGDFLIAVDMFDWGFGCFLLSHVIYMAAFGMGWTLRARPLLLYLLSASAGVSLFQLIGATIYGSQTIFYIVINIMHVQLFRIISYIDCRNFAKFLISTYVF